MWGRLLLPSPRCFWSRSPVPVGHLGQGQMVSLQRLPGVSHRCFLCDFRASAPCVPAPAAICCPPGLWLSSWASPALAVGWGLRPALAEALSGRGLCRLWAGGLTAGAGAGAGGVLMPWVPREGACPSRGPPALWAPRRPGPPASAELPSAAAHTHRPRGRDTRWRPRPPHGAHTGCAWREF